MFDKEKIHELYPGVEDMMVEPMLIHNSTDVQLKQACDSGQYFGQLKKDGALYMFMVGENHECYLFGRTISKKTGLLTEKLDNVPHIYNVFHDLPPKTIILGELYYPGGSSRNTTEIMGCLPEKAIARQKEKGLIIYYIYDILMYDGIDFIKAQVDNWTRYQILTKVYEYHKISDFPPFIELAKSYTEDLYNEVGKALAAGEEGMVIKLKSGLYEPGKRPMTNWKAKKVDFIDAIITDFELPTKEYYGKDLSNWQYWMAKDNAGRYGEYHLPVGTKPEIDDENIDVIPVTKAWYCEWWNSKIIIGAYDKNGNIYNIGTIYSGISDNMKRDMTLNPDKYLMKVARIQCMEKDGQAKTLRHGFFIDLHEDKNPDDCKIENIF